MGVFAGLTVDHVAFAVADVRAAAAEFTDRYGLPVYATSDPAVSWACSTGVGCERIRLVLTEPRTPLHQAARYLSRHGDGVCDIALRVDDAAAAFSEAVRRGARPVSSPVHYEGLVTATVGGFDVPGFGDLTHTFVQRGPGAHEHALPGLVPVPGTPPPAPTGLVEVDHFAVAVEDGMLAATVDYYRSVLEFEVIFSDRITVGDQAMTTTAVQSRSGSVTLTLIEPDTSCAPGHVVEFLERHDGAGVQHMAFRTEDIATAVDLLAGAGVEFLGTPDGYYDRLADRLAPVRYGVRELRRLRVLVDEDHDGQLYQIFARSTHPRNTFFLEIIERLGSRLFGNGNITALYEAVERQSILEEAH